MKGTSMQPMSYITLVILFCNVYWTTIRFVDTQLRCDVAAADHWKGPHFGAQIDATNRTKRAGSLDADRMGTRGKESNIRLARGRSKGEVENGKKTSGHQRPRPERTSANPG